MNRSSHTVAASLAASPPASLEPSAGVHSVAPAGRSSSRSAGPESNAWRTAFADRLAAHAAQADALASDLDLMQYADITRLGTDRALLHLGAKYTEEVRGNVLGLGTDPEARD